MITDPIQYGDVARLESVDAPWLMPVSRVWHLAGQPLELQRLKLGSARNVIRIQCASSDDKPRLVVTGVLQCAPKFFLLHYSTGCVDASMARFN